MSVASPDSSAVNLEEWNTQSASGAAVIKCPPQKNKTRMSKTLPLDVKLKIIEELEQGKKRKVILQEYNLTQSTLSTFLAKRDEIRKLVNSEKFNPLLGRKRTRPGKFCRLEEVLWGRLKKMVPESGRKSITGPLICSVALEVAAELGLSGFNADSGWLHRFRQRHGLVKNPVTKLEEARTVSQSVQSVDEVSTSKAEEWENSVLPDIFNRFDPQDIFMVHETGLYFRCTPQNMLHFVGERCVGGKMAKERLTVMMVCNMTGTEKLPLSVVGRYIRPKSLKYVHTLPTGYMANTRAWMIPVYFEEWIKQFDATMQGSLRRVAVFLTSSVSHRHVEGLSAVTMVFLPPHTKHQPAHHGIVSSLKLNYRRLQLQHVTDSIAQNGLFGKFPISLLDSLLWLREAWQTVRPECIVHSFKTAGLHNSRQGESSLGDQPQATMHDVAKVKEFHALFEQIRVKIPMANLVTAEGFLEIDSLLATAGQMRPAELELAKQYVDPGIGKIDKDQEEAEANNHDDGDPDILPPAFQEAKQYLDTLTRFFQQHDYESAQENLKKVFEMQHHIHRLTTAKGLNGSRQTKVLDFFMRRGVKKARVPQKTNFYFFPRR